MRRRMRQLLFTVSSALFLAFAAVSMGSANDPDAGIEAAIAAGIVGEQADGYLGFAKPPPPLLRAQVDALNIERRAAYTQAAQAGQVTVEAFAKATGCDALARVRAGGVYSITSGVWLVRGTAPIDLPSYCAR